MIKLRVAEREADKVLQEVPHQAFQKALVRHWEMLSATEVSTKSVCWQFCWAKTGMGSLKAEDGARTAFDAILDISFEEFNTIVGHDLARLARYKCKWAIREVEKRLSESAWYRNRQTQIAIDRTEGD